MCRECGCGCCRGFQGANHGQRRMLTKAEKIENLKKYAEELKKELVAVEEHIQDLGK